MKTSRRSAALATLVGGSSTTLIFSVQAIVLVPLYLRAIGPHLYGAWLGSGDFLVWMQAFDLGLPNLMIQRIAAAHGSGDSKAVAEYFATGAITMAIVALAIGLAAFGLSYLLPGWMGLVRDEAHTLQSCFIVAASASTVVIFNNSIVGFARAIQNTLFVNVIAVISGLAGFAIALVLALAGWGLWSIALGLAARAVVSLAGSGIFLAGTMRGDRIRFFRVRSQILREFIAIAPATGLGGIGYAVMNQSETALVAIFLSPVLAAVLNISGQALEVARGLVDMIAFAAYGSFAHLTTSDQRYRTLQVHSEISSLRLSMAVALAAAYMAVNASLVSVWAGSSEYGGTILTILMAVQFIVVGQAFLLNYLYRAAGAVQKGSFALAAEGVVRVPLMIGLLLWLGLPGIPLAGIITGSLFGVLAYRWTIKEVASFAVPYPAKSGWVWATRVTLLVVGMLGCAFVRQEHWSYVLTAGCAMTLVGIGTLIFLDSQLSTIRRSLFALLGRIQTVALGLRG